METTVGDVTQAEARALPGDWGLVALLMVAMVFSIVDRQVLALLVEPIRADLALSDTQMSILLGPAFVSCYLLFGLPFGWAADRFPRRYVVALGIGVWSLATISCGLATSFMALALARALVGAGEASLTPASMSMLSDVFPRERMPFVTSVLSIAMHLGAAGAMLIGGAVLALVGDEGIALPLVGHLAAWQATFLVVGLPGMVLVVVFVLIREPARGQHSPMQNAPSAHGQGAPQGLVDFFRDNRRSLTVHISVAALLTLSTYAFVSWSPAYLMRVHAFSTEKAALALGVISLTCGPLGAIGGGFIATRLQHSFGRSDGAWIVMAASALGSAVFGGLAFTGNGLLAMLPFLLLAILFGSLYLGVVHGALQVITPTHLKGRLAAIMLMFMTGIGTTLGPVVVALLTDQVFADPQRVGYSVAIVAVASGLTAATLLLTSLSSFRGSYQRLSEHDIR